MTRLERIKYKPVPVRELLIEMKNLSELMIDLAYSAALFNSQLCAEGVIELEKRVDTLVHLLDMNAMLAARDAKDAESLVGVTVVAAAADKISDAARDIAIITLRGIGIHPIAIKAFKKMEEQLTRVQIKPQSALIGKRLGELDLVAKIGVDIIAIRRGEELIVNPKEDVIIKEGDTMCVRGTQRGLEEFGKIAEGIMRVLER
jgi:uncharacterized protein with PhoU and TrkA domain